MTLRIMNSIADQPEINYTATEAIQMLARSCFKKGFNTAHLVGEILIHVAEGTFFYFERLKNLSYVYIIYVAISDLSRDNLSEYTFEFSLFLVLVTQLALVQIAHIFISVYHSEQILPSSLTPKSDVWGLKKITLKILSGVLFIIMPLLTFAQGREKCFYNLIFLNTF